MPVRTTINANHIERRPIPSFRAENTDNTFTLSGYAALFNTLSQTLYDWTGGFREKIAPGAFSASLAQDDIRMLWNHNSDYPLARRSAGNLTLIEDATGLYFRATPANTSIAADLIELIRSNIITGMSFGFSVLDEEWDLDPDNQIIRTLLKIKLYEISPVTWPAYTDTFLQLGAPPQIPTLANAQPPQRLHLRRRYLNLASRSTGTYP